MIERKPIRFSRWTPVKRDTYIGYSYVVQAGPRGVRRIAPGNDRWMRAKFRIASSALASGVEEFTVSGGLGARSWRRTVLCSQEEAEQFFRDAIEAGSFMLKGTFRKALATKERRLEREVRAG